MIYADYDYYTSTYGGSAISAADWPARVRDASAHLDALTSGRAAENSTMEAIKMAVCAMADVLQSAQSAAGGAAGIASEKTGSYSVSYQSPEAVARATESGLRSAAHRYLAETGLLFRGVYWY